MSVGPIVRSSLWLYIGSIIFNVLGYFYWVIISFFTTPEIVGSASGIIAIEGLLLAAASLGVPTGIRRFLGASWAKSDLESFQSILRSGVVILLITNIPIGLVLISSTFLFGNLPGLSFIESIFLGVLVLIEFLPSLFYSIYNSILKTSTVAIADVLLSITKIVVSVLLLLNGYGLLALLIGIAIAFLIRSLYFSISYLKLRHQWDKQSLAKENLESKEYDIRSIIRSGMAFWIPNTSTIIGQSIGVLYLFFFIGKFETGLYQLSLVIAIIIYRLPDSIQTVMFPYLSGLNSDKIKIAWRSIRLSLAFTIPFVSLILFYFQLPFLFLNSIYLEAAPVLALLSIGALFHPIVSGYSSYAYSEGKYNHVISIGVVMSLTRVILVILLIPLFGILGAAISYSLGSFSALCVTLPLARNSGFTIVHLDIVKSWIPPLSLGFILTLLKLNWYFGIPLILSVTFLIYARISVFTKSDLKEIAQELLSEERARKIASRIKPLVSKLFGS